MDSVFAFKVFVQVAESRSLVAAGNMLGISASAVGKSISRLEERVGVRLFNRNTRSVTLTPEGARFLERCRRILAELDAANEEFSQTANIPSGRLRVSLPILCEPFISVLGSFQRTYPEISLDADFTTRSVDLVGEGFDAAIRSGDLDDSRLNSKRLGSYRMLLLASPDYLARRGTPQRPEDIRNHSCIQFRYPDTGKLQSWNLCSNTSGAVHIDVPASMISSNIEARVAFAIMGLGIVYVADFVAQEHISTGRLVPVLTEYSKVEGSIRLLWTSGRIVAPKLRAFIDFVSKHMTLNP